MNKEQILEHLQELYKGKYIFTFGTNDGGTIIGGFDPTIVNEKGEMDTNKALIGLISPDEESMNKLIEELNKK